MWQPVIPWMTWWVDGYDRVGWQGVRSAPGPDGLRGLRPSCDDRDLLAGERHCGNGLRINRQQVTSDPAFRIGSNDVIPLPGRQFFLERDRLAGDHLSEHNARLFAW